MPTNKLSPEIIHAAIAGFESQKARIDAQIADLRAMLPGGRTEPAGTPEVPAGKRRKLSAAARKRMKEGQRRRWAKIRGETEFATALVTPEPAERKRRLSAAGKANIVAAVKKRVAAKRVAPKEAPVKSTAKKKQQKKTVSASDASKTAPAL